MIENWVRPICDIYMQNRQEIDAMPINKEKLNRLSELNVIAQVKNICTTLVMHRAYKQ